MKENIFVDPSYFIELLEYDGWATDRILDALSAHLGDHRDRGLELMSHLLRAQTLWMSRVAETQPGNLPIWERDTLDECRRRRADNTQGWLKLLRASAAGDLARPVTYKNTKGETHTSQFREIITHVINHGTHHRAQVSLLLRLAGITPPPVDYIVYARTRG